MGYWNMFKLKGQALHFSIYYFVFFTFLQFNYNSEQFVSCVFWKTVSNNQKAIIKTIIIITTIISISNSSSIPKDLLV